MDVNQVQMLIDLVKKLVEVEFQANAGTYAESKNTLNSNIERSQTR